MNTPVQLIGAGTTASSSGNRTLQTMDEAQDRFLKLLVTQMKNQDPLNPMDNAQVTTQMAQISTVTGISKLNDTISGFLSKLNGLESLQGASLAGHHVLVSGNTLELANGAAAGGYELNAPAQNVTLTVMDATGRTIAQNNLGAQGTGMHTFAWDGFASTGAKAVDGRYTFKIEATASGSSVPVTTLAQARVNGVMPASSGLQLDLGALGVRAYSDIKQFQ